MRGADRAKVDRFGMEIVPLVTSGPPGVTGFAGGRPKATDIVGYWPALLHEDKIATRVRVEGGVMARVKLSTFAFARSGDKGDGSNVGIFVANAADYELIRRELTVDRVRLHFAAICRGEVERFEAPNLLALNFLLARQPRRRRQREPEDRRPGQDPRARAARDGDRGPRGAPLQPPRSPARRSAGPDGTQSQEGDLLFVTLERPGTGECPSPALAAELTALYRRDLRAEGVRAVLLAGAGRHFCAGADLEHLQTLQSASALDNRLDSGRLRDLFEAILRQEALTLALVQGSTSPAAAVFRRRPAISSSPPTTRDFYSEVRIGFVAAIVATYLPMRVRGSDLRGASC